MAMSLRGGLLLACVALLGPHVLAVAPLTFEWGTTEFSTLPAFSPHSRLLYAGLKDGTLVAWQLDGDGAVAFSFDTGHGVVTQILELVDGSLVTGGKDGTVRFWHGEDLEVAIDLNAGPIDHMILRPEGDVLTLTGGGLLYVLSKEDLRAVVDFGELMDVLAVSASPDGRAVALGTWEGVLYVANLSADRPVRASGVSETSHKMPIVSVNWAGGSSLLLSSAMDGRIILWDWGADLSVRCDHQMAGQATGAVFSPKEDMILAHNSRGAVLIMDLECQVIHEVTMPIPTGAFPNNVRGVFSPSGESVLLVDANMGGYFKWEFGKCPAPDLVASDIGLGWRPRVNSAGDRLIIDSHWDYPFMWNPLTEELLFQVVP